MRLFSITNADLTSRIKRMPRIYDGDRAQEIMRLETGVSKLGKELLAACASASPYLYELINKEKQWLDDAFGNPEKALCHELEYVDRLELKGLDNGLRRAKRRVALLTALCDLAGVWSLEQVTLALSRLADKATHAAIKCHVGQEIRRQKIPGLTQEDVAECGGMVALAMGKHGANELNYSSDIDLICLFDETRFDRGDQMDARAAFIRATRRAMASLSDLTSEGYVFRTDLRLRPDPSVTPVCFAMEAAERYYESVGRTWERAAYIKARSAAGDLAAGDRFLTNLTPFVWRKSLDFHAIQETHDMRKKIRKNKKLGDKLNVIGHNVKLGLGGIREIEFYAQTRQLIMGGRNPHLRSKETVEALKQLAQTGVIEATLSEGLQEDYRSHRELEHRLQMLRDAQTHSIPQNEEELARLAALMDKDLDVLLREVEERCHRVDDTTEDFFAPSDAVVAPKTHSEHDALIKGWGSYACLRSIKAQEIFERIKPNFIHKINALDNSTEALKHLDLFLKGLPAGVQLFSLFEANPQLIDLILDIVSVSPYLGEYLSQNAAVLDAVIGGAFFGPWPSYDELKYEVATKLQGIDDYERQLDLIRIWKKEWHFRVGVHFLKGLISADVAGQQYSDIARTSLDVIYPCVVAEFSKKHGKPPGAGLSILGLGSLGARKLTCSSDLDIIVIYNAAGVEASDGPKQLPARAYYTRLTQALITAITAPTAEGRLYEVDMRLRPSGKQGPVATSLSSWIEYQNNEAWVWEHLALSKGEVITGDKSVCADVAAFRDKLIRSQSDRDKILRETAEMRQRLAKAKPGSKWDPKQGPGRLMDIELFAQAGALIVGSVKQDALCQLRHCFEFKFLSKDDLSCLLDTYDLFWKLQSAARLLGLDFVNTIKLSASSERFFCSVVGVGSIDEVEEMVENYAKNSSIIISTLLEKR